VLPTHAPRKRFGQNFLVDTQIIANILATVNAKPGQHIVEIGPGQGALTSGLVASGAKIDAIELDRDLSAFLSEHFAKSSNFKLYSADILNFELQSLLSSDPSHKLRLVGNLPYNISSPLLFKLFENIDLIADMYFMLQREVAERLIATPGHKAYGRMSVMAQYYCEIHILIDVPPHAFDPAPKVDSSIVYFKPHMSAKTVVHNQRLLQQITTAAFNQRRKTIHNSLKNIFSNIELLELNIDPQLRAENLTLSDYAKLSNYLHLRNSKQE
jgi:16S rRNA (adenine1518-N6/adenine1519-N6)-dimethyltransferase